MSAPLPVINPHFSRSRREICPMERAFMISWRFLRAFSASLSLSFEGFFGSHMQQPPPLVVGRTNYEGTNYKEMNYEGTENRREREAGARARRQSRALQAHASSS
jgi:hypothetical protein